MDIVNWAKQNKLVAGTIGAGGLFFLLHRGNTANADVTSSDGTAAGAPADGQHVQLIPVSSDNAGTDATGDPSLGGGIDQMPTVSGNDPTSNQDTLNQQFDNFMQLLQLQQQIQADNAAAAQDQGPTDQTPSSSNDSPIVPSGPGASGNIAAAAATKSASNPPGHPGYTTKTVIKNTPAGKPEVYHEHVYASGKTEFVAVRPATHPAPKKSSVSHKITVRRPAHPAASHKPAPKTSHHAAPKKKKHR